MPIQQMPTAPQPAPVDLQLPPTFPQLPDDVVQRFPSLQLYQDQVNQWFEALSQALTDANTTIAGLINNIPAQIQVVQAEVDEIAPGDYAAGSPVATGTVDGVDGAGNARKYLVI